MTPSTYSRIGTTSRVQYGPRKLIGLTETVQSIDPHIQSRVKVGVYVADDGSVTTYVVRSTLTTPVSTTLLLEGFVHPAVLFIPNSLHQHTAGPLSAPIAPIEDVFSELLFSQNIARSWKCEEKTKFEYAINEQKAALVYQGYYSRQGILDSCVDRSPSEVGALCAIYCLLNHSRLHLFFLEF